MKTALLLACLTGVCVAAATNSPLSAVRINRASEEPSSGFIGAEAESRFLGTNYIARLHWSDVHGSPKWSADGKPPLSPKEAESLAREYLERHIGPPPALEFLVGTEAWHPSEIALRRWLELDFWYYEVKLRPYINGSYNYPPVTVFVTMSGWVSPLVVVADRSSSAPKN
jgi:hypothetical protein